VRFRRCGPLRQPFRLPPPRAGEELLRFRQHWREIMPGVACRDLGDLLRRAFGDNLAALHAAFGTHVDDPVRRFDDVEIMFDDHHAVALFDQAVKDL